MERYFIIIVEEFSDLSTLSDLVKELETADNYRALSGRILGKSNAANLPINPGAVEWAVCAKKAGSVVKGVGSTTLNQLLCSESDYPVEPWSSESFSSLSHRALDLILAVDTNSEFWKSFDPSNAIKVCHVKGCETFNQKLYWRGALKMKDPHSPATNFGQILNAELSYDLSQLDLLVSEVRNESLIPQDSDQKIFICPTLELVGAVHSYSLPFIFYSATSLVLTVPTDSLVKALNEEVSLLFRLDYATEEVDNWNKETKEVKCVHFLGHLMDQALHLFALKNAEQVQQLANVFSKSSSNFINGNRNLTASRGFLISRLDKEIRRLQLAALQMWMKEKESLDEVTMTEIMEQVAQVVCKRWVQPATNKNSSTERLDLAEIELLRWKLTKPIAEIERPPTNNPLLQPNGKTLTVDVNCILRSMNKAKSAIHRSPRKCRTNENRTPVRSRMKPSTDITTAQSSPWPASFRIKYHGIDYNVDEEREKAEKQLVDFQEKWVPNDTASWCNPWSFHTSVAFQLTTAPANNSSGGANRPAAEGQRTPRKSLNRDAILLRKSPRLLAKNEPRGRRTPQKKTAAGGALTPSKMNAKVAFKQKLKVVIIKVLSEHHITPKDPLFRTCANKLSVICMELLKDSKAVASSRQMYAVAKSHAKQVVQFVKDK